MPHREPVADLTIREVAGLTKQNFKTVQKLVRQGRFPNAYKAATGAKNSPIRIPYSDVERYRATQPLAYEQ